MSFDLKAMHYKNTTVYTKGEYSNLYLIGLLPYKLNVFFKLLNTVFFARVRVDARQRAHKDGEQTRRPKSDDLFFLSPFHARYFLLQVTRPLVGLSSF